MMFGGAAVTAVTMAAYKTTSGMTGFLKEKFDDNEDRLEYKEKERKTYRRPIEETIEILGEGRGELRVDSATKGEANVSRYLCSWLLGEAARAPAGEVRRGRWPLPGQLEVVIAHAYNSFAVIAQIKRLGAESASFSSACIYCQSHFDTIQTCGREADRGNPTSRLFPSAVQRPFHL